MFLGESLMKLPRRSLPVIFAFVIFSLAATISLAKVIHDAENKTVVMADAEKHLVLRLNYDGKCILDQVQVRGQEVVPATTGVSSGIQVAGQWFTTRAIPSPNVTVTEDTAVVKDIIVKGSGIELRETWTFTVKADGITWRISRRYAGDGTLDDTYFPGWDFNERAWTGALLGTGGVAWFKLFDTPVASYGVHTGPVTFWNKENNSCLRIVPTVADGKHVAVRFSRHPHGVISCNYSVTEEELAPKHEQYRFFRDRQDVWAPFKVTRAETAVEFALSGLDYAKAYDRGSLQGIEESTVREISNTIARLGAVDAKILGSNGWYSGYAVLQEQWIAQLGLAIDDPHYFQAYAETLDYQRDHAVEANGRVKSRWYYNAGDAMPGTFDKFGFYECRWGWMLDSQPAMVTNVAEQFDFTGDVEWVRRHKATSEKALGYLLARDSNGNGLVEVMTDSHAQQKGSDWADIVWASFENGMINAEMYNALVCWSDVEEQLGDSAMAAKYRACAKKLKECFNRSTTDGGLWDDQKKCYAHWRDKDGSVHGTNMVTPVNFMAIGYGLCDDPARRSAILDKIEEQMQREKLFIWPLCMTSYTPEEGGGGPFPTYENGDIFLAWGELGMRAYSHYKPEIAVRCLKNVLGQYAKDGLAFQRYLRKTQTGEGDDILSNMASPIVGLYRDIYGIQPKWNRLYLEPHITPELGGTILKYWLRDQTYNIELKPEDYTVTVGKFTVRGKTPFAVDSQKNTLTYYHDSRKTPSLTIVRSAESPVAVRVESWPDDSGGVRKWSESCDSASISVRHTICDLPPNKQWKLFRDGVFSESLKSDAKGEFIFDQSRFAAAEINYELRLTEQ
jgi:hypothetical protein